MSSVTWFVTNAVIFLYMYLDIQMRILVNPSTSMGCPLQLTSLSGTAIISPWPLLWFSMIFLYSFRLMHVLAHPVSIKVFVLIPISGECGPFGSTYETDSIAYGIAGSSVTTGNLLIAAFVLCRFESLELFCFSELLVRLLCGGVQLCLFCLLKFE